MSGAETKDAQEAAEKKNVDLTSMRCRFYENRLPKPDEVVMVNVTEVTELGAYVTLLEYDNIEGLILRSELSRRRIRSINKLVRVNRTEIVMVVRVDTEKGYIDLSKRRVDPEDVVKCEERYNKAKAVHSVMRHLSEMKGKQLEDMYKAVGWPLYRKYGHAYDALKMALLDPEEQPEDIFKTEGLDVDEDTKQVLLTYIKRRLAPQPVKIRADMEVTCFSYEGIDAIKEALLAGEAQGTKDAPMKVRLIAPPMYVITSTTTDKEVGLQTMNAAVEVIANTIQSKGGTLDLKMAPKIVTDRDDDLLQAMMARLAQQHSDESDQEPET